MPKHAPYLVRRCCLAVLAAAAVTEPSAARGQTSCTSATQVIGYSAQYETCTTTGTVGSSITEEVNGPQQNGLSYTNQGTVNNAVNGAGAVNLLANGTPIAQGGTYSYLFAPGITATNNGTITSTGPAKSGMYVVSTGAPGTADGTVDDPDTAPNNHYMGRDGGTVTVNQQGRINVETSGSAFQLGLGGLPQPLNAGIDARSYGGAGTADASGHSSNGPGGDAGTVTVTNAAGATIALTGSNTAGIYALSAGGQGPGYSHDSTHNFDSGGNGNSVTVTNDGAITGTQAGNVGIYALSVGGSAGATDSQYSLDGGDAGTVNVTLNGSIGVAGKDSIGIFAASAGGLSWYDEGGHQNGNGNSVWVTLNANATITTNGELGVGVIAASTGGNSNTTEAPPDSLENGGSPNAVPTTRAPAGNAGDVQVSNAGSIATQGDVAIGIAAVSSTGGTAVSRLASGGTIEQVGSGSGSPGTVQVGSTGSISTTGAGAAGILALSLGGAGGVLDTQGYQLGVLGGSDGVSNGIGGNSVTVTASNRIATTGDAAIGILAESIGGGGGTATGQGGVIAVGGSGGGGGSGGTVSVTTQDESFTTSGAGAVAILAQSIGGGGGNGGNATGIVAAVGGSGGGGGAGGMVTVTTGNDGTVGQIGTTGDFALGVLAQSVGGSGGHGGYSTSAGAAVSAAIGGAGAGGGAGGGVTFTNRATVISTEGAAASAVLAQSVGGGGGNGGAANSYSAGIWTAAVAVGGSGGSGGDGGTVQTTNDYHLFTQGSDAFGLHAQSIGGGGGNGGSALAKAFSVPSGDPDVPEINVTAAIGGKGGGGGQGGAVTVANSGMVTTSGDGAHAILAQSIGGGGGNGADATASSTAIEGAATTVKISLALAGDGGSGSGGGDVTVTSGASSGCGWCNGQISTTGNNAAGILAQSIAGGGGNGGVGGANTSSPDLYNSTGTSITTTFTLGGSGGQGGQGGTVEVTNDQGSSIATTGSGSQGILAQSIGGGGGNAGGGTGGGSGDNYTVNVTLGASGGSGNDGGAVTVTNDGTVATGGGDAIGIAAQSIGAGGGMGGSSDLAAGGTWDNAADQAYTQSKSYQLGLSVGGSGGAAGDGGDVTLSNSGTISTQGVRAYGMMAQSIGGGGGSGGGSTATTGGDVSLTLSVGGEAGVAGQGGTLTLDQSGTITTQGYAAHGMLAQTIGGGGGVAGVGSTLGNGLITIGAVGDNLDAGGGDGGTIQYTGSGSIRTAGNDAYGILAQSIGGGGGTASLDSAAVGVTLGTANVSNNVTGDGGAITITQSGGSITTAGARAFGLVAQSIGGSGGLIGMASGQLRSAQYGYGFGFGGPVTVTLGAAGAAPEDATIQTSGAGAYGMLVQSISLAGGFAGDSSLSLATPVSNSLSAFDQVGANGGAIDITLNGNITTTGTNAHGLFVQSLMGGGGVIEANGQLAAGGNTSNFDITGNSGTITIQQNGGAIAATGQGSIGIFAQGSGSTSNNAPISITVNGSVQGGTGAGAAGIELAGGVVSSWGTNTVTIGGNGSVGTVDGTAGTAIRAVDAPTTVVNNGVLVGSVDLGAGSSGQTAAAATAARAATLPLQGTLINHGAFAVGREINAATVINQGGFWIGGRGVTATTHITGDFVQRDPGILRLDADHAQNKADRLVVDGDVALAGRIRVNPLSLADRPATVLTAGGTLTIDPSLVVRGTHVVRYDPTILKHSLQVTPRVDFHADDGSLDGTRRKVAARLQEIWARDQDIAGNGLAGLVTDEDGGRYGRRLDSLTGATAAALGGQRLQASRGFVANMRSCPTFEGAGLLLQERSCGWGKVIGSDADRDGSSSSPGYDVKALTTQLGGQQEVREGWFLGGSIGYERSDLNGDHGLGDADGDAVLAGVILKRQDGPLLLSGAIDGGYGWYDSTRPVDLATGTEHAEASPKAGNAGLHLGASYQLPFARWYLRPTFELSADYARTGSFDEHGAAPFNLDVAAEDKVIFSASPGIELGSRIDLAGGSIVRPYLDLGLTWSSANNWTPDARFADQPGSDDFRTEIANPNLIGHLSLGIDMITTASVDIKLQYDLDLASGYTANAGMLKAAYRF
ncbi:MAG: autotransporter outer membrane beta-barrel domain-containing protein [Geminicoccaceae bacterium]